MRWVIQVSQSKQRPLIRNDVYDDNNRYFGQCHTPFWNGTHDTGLDQVHGHVEYRQKTGHHRWADLCPQCMHHVRKGSIMFQVHNHIVFHTWYTKWWMEKKKKCNTDAGHPTHNAQLRMLNRCVIYAQDIQWWRHMSKIHKLCLKARKMYAQVVEWCMDASCHDHDACSFYPLSTISVETTRAAETTAFEEEQKDDELTMTQPLWWDGLQPTGSNY